MVLIIDLKNNSGKLGYLRITNTQTYEDGKAIYYVKYSRRKTKHKRLIEFEYKHEPGSGMEKLILDVFDEINKRLIS